MMKKTAFGITALLIACVLLSVPGFGAAFDVRGSRAPASVTVSDIIPPDLAGHLSDLGFDTDRLAAESFPWSGGLLYFFETDGMALLSSTRGTGLVILDPGMAFAGPKGRLITFNLFTGAVQIQMVSPTCILQISTALTTLVSAIYSCGFTENYLGCVTSLIGFVALLPIVQTECTAEYSLSITAINGSVTRGPDQDSYRYGQKVDLLAIPDPNYSFVAWSGAATGSENPITVTMTADRQVTANFSINTYTLTTPPPANGIIDRAPNTPTYAHGLTVTLTARPNAGYAFASWGGDLSGTTNPVQLIMDGDKTVAATFIAASP